MKVRITAFVTLIAGALVLSTATLSSATAGSGRSGSAQLASSQLASQQAQRVRLSLTPSSAALAECFPQATAKVTVDLKTDIIGKDRFTIVASGLRPNTEYTVFLLEQAGAPFGAAEYIGDFGTDEDGSAANTFKLIVEEAFAFNNVTQDRTDLNSVGFWFADPADDDECLGAGSPVTGFDGDAEAGVQMMNSGSQLLP